MYIRNRDGHVASCRTVCRSTVRRTAMLALTIKYIKAGCSQFGVIVRIIRCTFEINVVTVHVVYKHALDVNLVSE